MPFEPMVMYTRKSKRTQAFVRVYSEVVLKWKLKYDNQ